MYLSLQITITKSCKLKTIIMCTKMTNNDDIKQFQKKLHIDNNKKVP